MRSFTVGAGSLEVAQGLYSALADFHPELLETDDGTYQVRVTLVGGDNAIIATLNAIEKYVAERRSPARVELDGRAYTLHPD